MWCEAVDRPVGAVDVAETSDDDKDPHDEIDGVEDVVEAD
jgi:hypothetical protein